MERYEYAQLVEYMTFKGAFLRGAPVMAYFVVSESGAELLKSLALVPAMNELGGNGWQEYRVEYPEPKVPGMDIDRVKLFQQRHGFMPGGMQLESTRWFRRVVG